MTDELLRQLIAAQSQANELAKHANDIAERQAIAAERSADAQERAAAAVESITAGRLTTPDTEKLERETLAAYAQLMATKGSWTWTALAEMVGVPRRTLAYRARKWARFQEAINARAPRRGVVVDGEVDGWDEDE